MVSAIGTALTGLYASSRRLETSANNIANQHSTRTVRNGETVNEPYVPQQIDQLSLSTGGVQTVQRPVANPSVDVYDPDNAAADPETGITKYPNINLEKEIADQIPASYDFKANLKVIKTQDSLFKSLLNIFS